MPPPAIEPVPVAPASPEATKVDDGVSGGAAVVGAASFGAAPVVMFVDDASFGAAPVFAFVNGGASFFTAAPL